MSAPNCATATRPVAHRQPHSRLAQSNRLRGATLARGRLLVACQKPTPLPRFLSPVACHWLSCTSHATLPSLSKGNSTDVSPIVPTACPSSYAFALDLDPAVILHRRLFSCLVFAHFISRRGPDPALSSRFSHLRFLAPFLPGFRRPHHMQATN